jgi:hypothetical protein
MKHNQSQLSWAAHAVNGPLVHSHLAECENDTEVLGPLQATAPQETIFSRMDTAPSNPCCPPTVTKGPGCCQYKADAFDGLASPARKQLEENRLWPMAVG